MVRKRQKPNVSLSSALWMVCAIGFLIPSTLKAAELAYGGRLSEQNGKPFEGPIHLKIRFYHQESGGTPVGPQLEFANTSLTDGVFQVNLSLTPAQTQQIFGDPDKQVYIEVEAKDAVYSRQKFLAAPMALKVPVNTSQLFYNSEGKLSIESISVSQVSGLSSLLDSKANSSAVASITSAQITDGSIADADISPSASIADSKLAPITTAGKVSGSAITSGTIGGSTVFNSSGNITAADIAANGSLATKTELRLGDADNSNYVGLKAPTTVTTNRIWTLPATDGANGQLLSTNGSGTLSWITAAGSGDMLASANLSDLANTTTARTNLGLGSLATKSTVATADITDGTIVDADINASAAIAQSKISGLTTDLAAKQAAITTSSVVNSGTVTTALQNGVQIKPFNTAAGNTGELRFDELAANGANYVGFKAPDTLAADKIWTLPPADGTNGQVLKTDGSGNLGWVTGAAGSVTSVNLTAPAAGITVSGGPITGAGSIALALGDDLAAVEGISTTGGVERTAANTWSTYTLTAAGKALIDDADATAQRTTLGLGGLATLSAVGSTEVTNDSIMDADINSAAGIAQSKISGLTTALSGKEPSITAGTTAQYLRGDKTWQTLATDARAVLSVSAPLTYNSGTGAFALGQASGVGDGYLSSSDFTVFNNKQAAISAATTVNSGTLTTALQNGIQIKPYGAAAGNAGELRFNELAANGTNYIGFKAPDTLAADKIWTLPAADGTNGQLLKTDGSGSLSWISAGGGGDMFAANNLSDVANVGTARTNLGLGGLATLSAVGSTEITNDSIMNADINTAAGISTSKLSGAVTSITGHGLGGLATLSAVSGGTAGTITDDTITDADINSAAGIAQSKISGLTTALSGKEPTITVGTTAQYLRGDKSWQTLATDARAALSVSAPLTYNSGSGAFALGQASGVADGYLSSSDFTVFNNKQAAISAATTVNAGTLTTALQNAVQISPYGASAGNAGELRFTELAANGTNFVGFKAPDTLAADRIWTLPTADGTNGQVLRTNGSGVLSWVSPGGGGDLLANNNLSDLTNTATARTNLGLAALATASAVSGGTGGTITDDTITNADINSAAAIADTKLATISTAGKVSGSAITSGTIGGSTVVATSGQLSSTGNIRVAGTGATATDLRFGDNDDSNYVGLKAPGTVTTNLVWTLPAADGTTNQALSTNGSGVLQWVTPMLGSNNLSDLGNSATARTNLGLGALATTGEVSGGTGGTITDDTITNADINSAAAIVDTKLATISTAGKVSGSAITSGTIGGSTAFISSGNITTSSSITGVAVNSTTLMAGTGDAGASPAGGTLRAASGTGTNIVGSNLTVTAGNGTGTGGSGSILFQTAPVAGSGTTANTMATRLAITPDGNIGIGTTAPTTAKLVIAGSGGTEGLDLASNDQYANLRVIRNTNGPDKDMYLQFQAGLGSKIHLYSNNTETMTLDSGNVGIGTTSPYGNLNVYSTGNQTKVHVQSSLVGAIDIGYRTAVDSNYWDFMINRLGEGANSMMIGNGIAGNVMTFTTAGNVGIGTTAPAGLLDVNSKLTVLSGGNVGIGTTVPPSLLSAGASSQFQVNSSGDLVKVKNITYSWPGSQGGASTVLTNNGSGTLSWGAASTGTVTSVNLTAPAAGITVSGGPITGAGSITLALGDDLAAVEGIATTGGVERTAANTWSTYTLTAAGKALIDDADATAQRTTLGLGGLATLSAVGSSEITNDSIMNTDINSAAAIATSKLSGAVTSITGHGLGGLATLSAVGSTEITNDSIMDTDINSAAAIADTKLATISTAGKVSGSAITSGTIGGSTVFNSSGTITTSAAITGTGNIIVNGTGSTTTELRFNDNDNSNFVGFKAPATVSTNKLWTLPAADGTSGQVLKTDGSGALSWANGSGAMTGTGGGAAPNPSSGCPTGYILVPGDTDYGTTDFCVMKYEAKYGDKGAVSQATEVPARGAISQNTAYAACRNLGPGYALINNVEWMTIASNVANVGTNWSTGTVGSGALNRGHSDNSPADALAAVTDDNDPCNGTGQTCSSSTWHDQRRTHVLSNSNVIWDFSGNVWEWVDYFNYNNKPTPANAAWNEYTAVSGSTYMAKNRLVPTNALKSWWSDSWNGATNGIGQYYGGTNGGGGALLRGGNWNDGSTAGVFAVFLNNAPSSTGTNIGFRCVFRPSSL